MQPAIDAHCHLEPAWARDGGRVLRGVLARCRRHGVEALAVSVDCSEGRPEHDLEALEAFFAEAGVELLACLSFMPPTRPEELDTAGERQRAALGAVRALARRPSVRALGECGLDSYWPCVGLVREGLLRALPDGEPPPPEEAGHLPAFQRARAVQRAVFRRWIDLALDLDLPLVIHERLAHADAVEVLQEAGFPPARTMFHCFGAGPAEACAAAARGSVVSIPASILGRERYREVAGTAPLEALVVETDSPYHSPIVGLWKRCREAALAELGPGARPQVLNAARDLAFGTALDAVLPGLAFDGLPARERFREGAARYRNEPCLVRFAAPEIAAVRGLSAGEVQAAVSARARAFFAAGRG